MNIATPKPARTGQMLIDSSDVLQILTYTTGAVTALALTTHGARNIIVDTNTYATTVTLPPVAESAGMVFTVLLRTDGTGSVTVTDYGDDALFSDATLDDAGDAVVVYSNGVYWLTLATGDIT